MQTCSPSPNHTPLHRIVLALAWVIKKEKLDKSTKESLDEIITYMQDKEAKEQQRKSITEIPSEDNTPGKNIRSDLADMHKALTIQLNGIQDTLNMTLTSTDKLLKASKEAAANTIDLTSKIGKVTDTADKIATKTSKYQDAVLSKPAQSNRSNTNPKVLGDLEYKARQILIMIHNTAGNDTLNKSITELTTKANEAIGTIEAMDKPKEAKVKTIFKTHKGTLVLIFNSKEAARWIKLPEIDPAFTLAFSEGSYISERKFNLVIPRVPITFDPKEEPHL